MEDLNSFSDRRIHFVVSHPLGMHARVCSRWIKTLQKIRPQNLDYRKEWVWIYYEHENIPADSLFKLLETRIPYGAEFDLIIKQEALWDEALHEELESIVSHPPL